MSARAPVAAAPTAGWRNRIVGSGEEAPDQLLATRRTGASILRVSKTPRAFIVQALFEQMEVLGAHHVWLYASVEAEARGWAAAMTGCSFRVEVRKTGRGERDSPATNDLPITMRLAEPPEPSDWLRWA